MTNRSILAIVVTLHDDPRAVTAIGALRAQVGAFCRLLVIDNEAGPNPVDLGQAGGAVLTIERQRHLENVGLSGALESAIRVSGADFLLNINPDCILDPWALASAVEVLESSPAVGAVAFHLRRPDGTLDSAGISLSRWTLRAFDRGAGRSETEFQADDDVDAPCLAASLLRISAVRAAADGAYEVFDTRFMAYQEDVDLGWRLRRAGFRVRHVVKASGIHERGFRPGDRTAIPAHIRRWSLRNRWWTLIKNASWWGLLLRSPMIILQEGAIVGYLLVKEPGTLAAYADIFRGLSSTLRRRRIHRAP